MQYRKLGQSDIEATVSVLCGTRKPEQVSDNAAGGGHCIKR